MTIVCSFLLLLVLTPAILLLSPYSLLYLPGLWVLNRLVLSGLDRLVDMVITAESRPISKSLLILAVTVTQALLLGLNSTSPRFSPTVSAPSPNGMAQANVVQSLSDLDDYPYALTVYVDLQPNGFLAKELLVLVADHPKAEVTPLWLSATELQVTVTVDGVPHPPRCVTRQVKDVRIALAVEGKYPDCADRKAVDEYWSAK